MDRRWNTCILNASDYITLIILIEIDDHLLFEIRYIYRKKAQVLSFTKIYDLLHVRYTSCNLSLMLALYFSSDLESVE